MKMMNDRQFKEALDNYITGKNDPNAPFNQEDLPCCEDCEQECNQEKYDSCEIRKKFIEEQTKKMKEWEE